MHQELFDALKHDHAEVKDLLARMKETSEGAIKTRDNLLEKLRNEIVPHMRGEERGLYPIMEKYKETKKDAFEAEDEHHVARIVMHELEEMNPQDERWAAKQKVLSELIHHHIEEEESKIFKEVREKFSDQEAKEALEALKDAKSGG